MYGHTEIRMMFLAQPIEIGIFKKRHGSYRLKDQSVRS